MVGYHKKLRKGKVFWEICLDHKGVKKKVFSKQNHIYCASQGPELQYH